MLLDLTTCHDFGSLSACAAHVSLPGELWESVALRAYWTHQLASWLLFIIGISVLLILLHFGALVCQVEVHKELGEDWPVVWQIKHIVWVVALELEWTFLFVAAAVVQYTVRPCWVPLQTETRVVKWLTLKRWSERDVSLLELSWHVAKLPLHQQLVWVD